MHDRLERVKSFYWQAWFADEPRCPDATVEDVFRSGYVILDAGTIRSFAAAVGNRGEAFAGMIGAPMEAPLDFGIVAAWKAIMKPLFAINADILKLVHLSNQFRMVAGQQPLHEGDVVTTMASVTAIVNQEFGKMVEVTAVINRNGSAVMEITSQFLYRGTYNDAEKTFRISAEDEIHVQMRNAKDIAILNAKPCSANPVLGYLQRHGEPVQKIVPLDNPIPIEGFESQFCVQIPESNARASFQAMVMPGDQLTVSIYHTAMLQGRKVIKLEARNSKGEMVMSADAEVDQPSAAYIFTGQGSQRKGMGMELREKSPAAASVWTRADEYFQENYGFRITTIVQDDPQELTIHFGGPKGRRVRENYLSILRDAASSPHRGAFVRASEMYQALHAPRCTSYTFRSHLGLLSATHFTQPALTLMEVARFADLRARGLVAEGAGSGLSFAGHSLGEYGALAALGGSLMRVESLAAITFVRGLTMQTAVTRSATGRSAYSMCAVNPSKVCARRSFGERALADVVAAVGEASGADPWLLEIVNYNIRELQYICAGDVRALAALTEVLNAFVRDREARPWLDRERLVGEVRRCVERVRAMPQPVDYERGPATVPLKQIDVPFHSSFLAGGVDSYRRFLQKHIKRADIAPERLVGKWIPNVTGVPFGVSRAHFEEMHRVTNSPRLRDILDNWSKA
ncbi:putative fatty acid synthase subunit beta dehydratase protein [Neofusicoccum parvum UCRNP2]|uniref:Putative fatty acid synthase subunit beta dehydratase protein n=1 Tax=Botryosphaeria parva (strain UCR-NP2) TaxID=1287680 RepID=R1EQG3_BOTPV|nr:putative fatty acid synthase subunit beta dehydratase protein [Neofusicoccum parvum UCRNP2]